MQAVACSTDTGDVGGVLAQVKELALQVLPVALVAASAEPAPAAEEALPALETHQVRSWLGHNDHTSWGRRGVMTSTLDNAWQHIQ